MVVMMRSEVRPFELQAAAEAVDSLNVSVAAGILLHDLLSRSIQQRTPTPISAEWSNIREYSLGAFLFINFFQFFFCRTMVLALGYVCVCLLAYFPVWQVSLEFAHAV
jgi:hypothetical protein